MKCILVHEGKAGGHLLSYEEIGDYIIPYLKEHGFTHVGYALVQYPLMVLGVSSHRLFLN